MINFVAFERGHSTNEIDLAMPSPFRSAVAFCVMLFLILLTAGRTNEFIYFQF